MLNQNTQTQSSKNEEYLLSLYRTKLQRCGLSSKETSRLLKEKSIDELKAVVQQQRNAQNLQASASSSHCEPSRPRRSLTDATTTGRVWSTKPHKHAHSLSASRKRSKIEKALSNCRSIAPELDPLKHMGYVDDDAKLSRLDMLIESHLMPSHGHNESPDSH
jgi:hypothetical protein